MAEGFLRHYGGSRFEVFSAGTKPCIVNPTAIQVMKEAGIDISKQTSKSVSIFMGQAFDYVITVCDYARETCPVFPGAGIPIHWAFPDPPHDRKITEDVLREFRQVRDKIHEKFRDAALNGFPG